MHSINLSEYNTCTIWRIVASPIPIIATDVTGARALMANAIAEAVVAVSTTVNTKNRKLSISCSKPSRLRDDKIKFTD